MLSELSANYEKHQNDYSYNQHRYQLLENINLENTNLDELEALRDKLSNSEEIKLAFSQAYYLLLGEEGINVLAQTKEAYTHLQRIGQYYKAAEDLSERIKSVRIELQDIADVVQTEHEQVNYDPDELEKLNSRIDNLYALLQNFRAQTIDELISIKNELKAKLETVDNFEVEISKLQKELNQAETDLKVKAEAISEKRKNARPAIQNYINELLHQLGMPNANFVIEILPANEYLASGNDELRFLFTANKNTEYQELSKVASGGEISRVMLTIKSLLSKHSSLPTIIFDEIDTGVSGDIASKMGQIMAEMGKEMQVISITHLPQVAAQGQRHYMVYKYDTEESTNSAIQLLDKEKRIEELAKMLSGSEMSKAAIENAKSLLGQNN
jgi:DNA repair protein RecN (Recombination protein N)